MTRSSTTVQVRPLQKEIFNIPEQRHRVFDSPKPSFILAALRPRIRSHMYSVLSFPTLSATFPDGCTDTELTRPLWPFSDRSTAQSRARKTQRVPSSDAEMRCEREGKVRWVMEPENNSSGSCAHKAGTQRCEKPTFMLHEPADFLPSPEIPNLDDLVSAPRCKPFPTLW